MKLSNTLFSVTLAITSFGFSASAKADTVGARCDVFAKGSDRASSSASCTFSQRQGAVGIQLQNGKRFDLLPITDKPGKYRDQTGQVVRREDSLGDLGQVYRFPTKSIFVYWDRASSTNPINQSAPTGTAPITPAPSTNIALVGKPVDSLSDLVGAKAGQAENTVRSRGYQFVRGDAPSFDGRIFSYWREPGSGLCVAIITKEGRYANIVYAIVINQKTCK